MKLYYSVQRASDPASPEPWQVPGKQDKKAERVDVPGSPAELAAWLNVRGVPLAEAQRTAGERPEPSDEGHFWEAGPATKEPPRYDPKHHGDFGNVEFVPITRSAAIAASYGACPKCQRTWAAQVLAGIATASLDELQTIGEAIKRHVAELAEQIEERSVQ
jgi:hypothetical protein